MTGKRASAAQLLCLSQNSRRSRLLATICDFMVAFGTGLSPKRGGGASRPIFCHLIQNVTENPHSKCSVR